MKYRSKPVEPVIIDAFRWPSDNPPLWFVEALNIGMAILRSTYVHIERPDGGVNAFKGDWIMVNGRISCCTDSYFRATYEPA